MHGGFDPSSARFGIVAPHAIYKREKLDICLTVGCPTISAPPCGVGAPARLFRSRFAEGWKGYRLERRSFSIAAVRPSLTRGSPAGWLVKDDHITRAAARTAQAAFQQRKRKCPAPRPNQRFHVECLAIVAFAARLRVRTLGASVSAADSNTPTLRTGLAERFDRHRRPSDFTRPTLKKDARNEELLLTLWNKKRTILRPSQGGNRETGQTKCLVA